MASAELAVAAIPALALAADLQLVLQEPAGHLTAQS